MPADLAHLKSKPRIALAWLIVPCLAADGLMVPVLSSLQGPPRELPAAIAFGIVGCVLAQGCLLAAWLAWSDGPFPQRLARHWLIATGLYAIWLVGLALASPRASEVPRIAATVALGIPLVSLAAQFPPWVWRHLWGWRLVRETAEPTQSREAERTQPHEQRLTIRDLMVATLVVAASLALARLAAPADGHSVWPIWAFACTVAVVVSSVTLLPAGVFLLRPRPLRRGLFWSAIYAASWISLVWIAVAAKWWFAPQMLIPRAIYVGLSSLMFTFAATLTLAATIAKLRGYRLASHRVSSPSGRGPGRT
jgi:hypothetical protein